MALSTLTLTFLNINKVNRFIRFYVKSDKGVQTGPYIETFIKYGDETKGKIKFNSGTGVISQSDQDIIDSFNNSSGVAAFLYASKLGKDYNQSNLFSISSNGSNLEVVIVLNKENYTFVNIETDDIATYVLNNVSDANANKYKLNIVDYDYLGVGGGAECDQVGLSIDVDQEYTTATINGAIQVGIPADTNFTTILLRDVDYRIVLSKFVDGLVKIDAIFPTAGVVNIPSLSPNNFLINIISKVNIGSIRVNPTFASLLTYDYKIDDGGWQSSNYFTNLDEGDYTLYIRDRLQGNLLGCEISIPFTIDLDITKQNIIDISKENSLTFKRQQDIDNNLIPINNENSFDNLLGNSINYCQEALFSNTDQTRIQLKSSFENITVTFRDENLNETNIPINQRTDNINKYKSMDCIMDYYTDEQSIIYFTSGKTYNELDVAIGTYNLNGNLPDFAIIGEYIDLDTYGSLEILDIIYFDSINKYCLIVGTKYLQTIPTKLIVRSKYSILPFNVFDFDILWSVHGNGIYDVLITFEDDTFDTEYYLSENIYIDDYHFNTIGIRYYNDNNRSIFYKFEIEHFIRIPIIGWEMVIKDDVENNITDSSVDIVKSTVNEGAKIIFDELTSDQLLKVSIALSCEYVFINNIGFTKSQPFSFEPVKNTNMQSLVAEMLKNGSNYGIIHNYETGIDNNSGEIEVPNLLVSPTNFLKF